MYVQYRLFLSLTQITAVRWCSNLVLYSIINSTNVCAYCTNVLLILFLLASFALVVVIAAALLHIKRVDWVVVCTVR